MTRLIRTLIFAIAAFVVAAGPALGATFVVTTADDSGLGSLRDAITQAETDGTADVITFDADYTIMLASPLPNITTDITISGNGWERTIIDGGNSPGGTDGARAFLITTGGFLTLDAVTISNCYGSAVINQPDGHVLVTNSQLSQNKAVYGGAIITSGVITVESTSFIDNESYGGGAVNVYGSGSTFEAHGCTFSGNVALGSAVYFGWGGAIAVQGSNTTAGLTNCTFFDNSAEQRGGAIYFDNSTATLSFVTLAGNTATAIAGGIYLEGSSFADITHSIVTDVCADDGGEATLTTQGYNLDAGDTCGFSAGVNDLINTDPQLGALQANGGPTLTMALPPSSPAVDAGDVSCGAVATDQRGLLRPVDGDGDSTAECDIGAYEYQRTIFSDGFESGDTSAWNQD